MSAPGGAVLALRPASMADLDALVRVDRKDEGGSSTFMDGWGAEAALAHREKLAGFVRDEDKAAWVYCETETGRVAGMILWRYRNRLRETFEEWSIIPQLAAALFPADGAFAEIYQLWIVPEYRRRGWGLRLKQQVEAEALRRGVGLVYTHTAAENAAVIGMNAKLGYREVRRGVIWDEVVRVSMIKSIG